ncbi:tyrosine-type recombinase/integrase [Aquabacterium sp.]|uniref:tyrosine-type recombinase/integrase n=1 Tax=Aquabacterium sp. TaxID=1872578 RepID=UPI0025C33B6A|nr:tyrosine-type recombinase/integrase [Aquabacterium sp.]
MTLLKATKDGKATWRLLGPNGLPLDSFTAFADSLLRKHGFNTRNSYCRHLAIFYDYLFEYEAVLKAASPGEPLTRARLKSVLEAFDEYLVHGEDSGNEIAKLVSQSRPSTRYAAATSALMHAPLRKFLSLSEHIRQELQELSQLGMCTEGDVDTEPLLHDLHSKVPVTPSQHRAMTANSMISGVISGGPKFLKSTVLPTTSPQVSYDDSRAFPFDEIESFIKAQTTFRDKALYAFLAASGCRNHEGLQLLFDDLDISAGTVALRDPALRANHPSYLYLSPEERDLLAWKGRTTESTLLLEPFASMFFESLEHYMAKEYVPHGLHRFVFQYLKKGKEGRPYFLSSHNTRLEAFKRAAAVVGLEGVVSGPHSLRHAYGTYLLNYFPRLSGDYGLPIAFVQQLMGHAEEKSTLRYARYDKDLMQLELRHANAMVYNGAEPKSIDQLKLEALNAQVRKLQQQIGLTHA